MDPRVLEYYDRELQYVREMGAEFAQAFPKIAGRLGLDGIECADPYVERLLEGFAFLAARVHLKIDDEFPAFTQHLLEMVYPHYLSPTPSMAVVQFRPNLDEGSLAEGFVVPRHTAMRGLLGDGEQTACEYRTAHDVTLWPLEIAHVEYFNREAAPGDLPALPQVKACLQIRLRSTAGLALKDLSLDQLPLYVGSSELAAPLYEQLLADAVGIAARDTSDSASRYELLDSSNLRRVGFAEQQSLLPYGSRSFQGYRLLHEYFAFPQRYLFVELTGLKRAVKRCTADELDIFILLDALNPRLDNAVASEHLRLFCTPAVNLFPKRADRIHLDDRSTEHHVVPDRTRPMDYEVYSVNGVTGHGTAADEDLPFRPFYSLQSPGNGQSATAFYTTRRMPRVPSSNQARRGARSSYIGSEVFVSLVDWREAPYSHDLRQLSMTTLCTNRDLPLFMPIGATDNDFALEIGAPVESINCIAGPTRPKPSFVHAQGELGWRLVSHLSLNYLSLSDTESGRSAAALRELLRLYADLGDDATRKQIDGVVSVSAEPVVRQHPTSRRMSFGRGLEVAVTFEEAAFHGSSAFLLGGVLQQFFARYVSLNSFTETCIKTDQRGEIMRWPATIGRRHTI